MSKVFYKHEVTKEFFSQNGNGNTNENANGKLKTVMCERGKNCIYGKDCWFAHSEEELVKVNNHKALPQISKYRTIRCRYDKKDCIYGDECCFAHSDDELLAPLCRYYKNCKMENCRFRHEVIIVKSTKKDEIKDKKEKKDEKKIKDEIKDEKEKNRKIKNEIMFEKGRIDDSEFDGNLKNIVFTKNSSWGDELEFDDEDKNRDEKEQDKESEEEKINKLVNKVTIYPCCNNERCICNKRKTKKYVDVVKGIDIPQNEEEKDSYMVILDDKISKLKINDKEEDCKEKEKLAEKEEIKAKAKLAKEKTKEEDKSKAKIIENFLKNKLKVGISEIEEEKSSVRIELGKMDNETNLINVNINISLKSSDLGKLTEIIKILKNV